VGGAFSQGGKKFAAQISLLLNSKNLKMLNLNGRNFVLLAIKIWTLLFLK